MHPLQERAAPAARKAPRRPAAALIDDPGAVLMELGFPGMGGLGVARRRLARQAVRERLGTSQRREGRR